jgi:hypothetical protein
LAFIFFLGALPFGKTFALAPNLGEFFSSRGPLALWGLGRESMVFLRRGVFFFARPVGLMGLGPGIDGFFYAGEFFSSRGQLALWGLARESMVF